MLSKTTPAVPGPRLLLDKTPPLTPNNPLAHLLRHVGLLVLLRVGRVVSLLRRVRLRRYLVGLLRVLLLRHVSRVRLWRAGHARYEGHWARGRWSRRSGPGRRRTRRGRAWGHCVRMWPR